MPEVEDDEQPQQTTTVDDVEDAEVVEMGHQDAHGQVVQVIIDEVEDEVDIVILDDETDASEYLQQDTQQLAIIT